MNDMKRKVPTFARRLCACLLAVVLTFGCVGIHAFAADTQEDVRMNVMLVIDGSGSLTSAYGATDPKGLRYDAIDLFLALLTNSGNNVGAIVFNEGSDRFLLEAPLAPINGKSDKLALSKAIRSAGTRGDTNIGAALLKGVNEATAMSQSNGLPSVVILFSDGRTDVPGKDGMEKSLQAKEAAIVAAQNARIPIYTICLAANQVADPAEMQEIAERSSGAYANVTTPEDLSNAFEAFYTLIFASAGSEIQQAGYDAEGKMTFEVPIPAYGAEEVNIILNRQQLHSKTITTPNGVMSAQEMDECTMSGGYYDVIKIVDPAQGSMLVELTGVPDSNVTVNVLYNINSVAELSTADGRQLYAAGDTVTFRANLIQNGNPILSGSVTSEYSATLTLTDLSTGESRDVAMTPDGNGTFTYNLNVDSVTSYSAVATLRFGNLELRSAELNVGFDNSAPTASTLLIEEDIYVLYFFNASKKYDLSSIFSDAQGSPLTYSILHSQLVKDTAQLDPQTGALTIRTSSSRSGDLVVQAADPQGATARMTIRLNVTNLTLGVSLAILAAILIAAGIFGYAVLVAARKPWKGRITVTNLSNGMSRSLLDFRGSLKLKKFGLGKLALDGKFVTSGRGHLEFVSRQDVYAFRSGSLSSAVRRVTLQSGTVTIYADKSKTRGITVKVEPLVRSNIRGGFGGIGGIGGGSRPQTSKNNTKPSGNPFR